MTKNQIGGMSPVKLKIVLYVTITVIIILTAVGFWFFRGWLANYADTVSKDAKQAAVSSNDIATLQRLKTQMEEEKIAVNRTKNIVADSKSYEYQNQIISDLNAYATASGIGIGGYSFESSGAATGASGAATPQPPTTTAGVAPAGLKTTSVQVTVKNPVKYEAIMRFVHSIEANLTKMQLTGVSLAKDAESSGGLVTVEPLTVEVYIR